jgi:hypothetical protein
MHYIQMHYIQMHYIADAETVEFLKRTRTPEATEAIRSKPATYVHGEDDRAIPLGFGVGCFRDLWPDDPVTTPFPGSAASSRKTPQKPYQRSSCSSVN